MKNSMQEFYEQTLLCATAAVIVLCLNSYFSKDESLMQSILSVPVRREQIAQPALRDSLTRDSILYFNDVRAMMTVRDTFHLR